MPISRRRRYAVLGLAGVGVGTLTGLVGVGGGFLIVPALVLVAGVPMKRAIGTSLLLISLTTMAALAAYSGQASISWPVVAVFTVLAIAGTLLGTRAVQSVPAGGLRRAFGMLVLGLAAFLLYENGRTGARATTPAAARSR